MNRRELLQGIGLSFAAWPTRSIAKSLASVAASEKLTVACIGTGSQGLRVLLDMLRLPEVQVVAICDVNRGSSDYLDWGPDELKSKVRTALGDANWGSHLPGPTAGREPAQAIVNAFYAKETRRSTGKDCAAYEDYRELLAKHADLDAVIVSTPDHWHAPIAVAAMQAGKHVYSQKPMAHSVWECREMVRVAKETGRATQVSIFDSDSPSSQQVHDVIKSGAIGAVQSIDIWTKRASAFWKQGLATPNQADPIPAGFNWDMWLGPAPMRPFSRSYLPFIWRAWYDFGCGAVGDMGEYGFDTISRALDLQSAHHIEASSTDRFPECYPVASSVHFDFAKTSSRPELKLNWYDGGIEPDRPSMLPDNAAIGNDGEGVIYHGESGKLLTAYMGEDPRILSPDGKITPAPPPPNTTKSPAFWLARPELGPSASGADAPHYLEWIRACQGGPPARANYANQAPIVESLLLGCIAQRTHEVLNWDANAFALVGASGKAKSLLKPQHRTPWGFSDAS